MAQIFNLRFQNSLRPKWIGLLKVISFIFLDLCSGNLGVKVINLLWNLTQIFISFFFTVPSFLTFMSNLMFYIIWYAFLFWSLMMLTFIKLLSARLFWIICTLVYFKVLLFLLLVRSFLLLDRLIWFIFLWLFILTLLLLIIVALSCIWFCQSNNCSHIVITLLIEVLFIVAFSWQQLSFLSFFLLLL